MRSRRAIMKVAAWRHHDAVPVACELCPAYAPCLREFEGAPGMARLPGPEDTRKPERPAATPGQPEPGRT